MGIPTGRRYTVVSGDEGVVIDVPLNGWFHLPGARLLAVLADPPVRTGQLGWRQTERALCRLYLAAQHGLGKRWADESAAALVSVRELIERIEVQPAADGKGLEIELTGAIASMVRLGLSGDAAARRALLSGRGDHGLFASSVKVVAGARN